MSDDPLAKFRGTTPGPTKTPPSSGTVADEYVAFGTKDRVMRVRIRSTNAPAHAPGYNILLNVTSDDLGWTNFVLTYSILMVEVRGRNLQKLVVALENHMADYIQEFDPKRWPKPADPCAAFIESIQVVAALGGKPMDDTRH